MVEHLEKLFPKLQSGTYRVTSTRDEAYNCIAWAAGDASDCWWPADHDIAQWPEGVPREETLEAFRAAFAALGYLVCDGTEAEVGFEKIAVFADDQHVPRHAARQLPGGRWTSKLGKLEDIEHALTDLEGTEYGSVVLVMKRPQTAVSGGEPRSNGA